MSGWLPSRIMKVQVMNVQYNVSGITSMTSLPMGLQLECWSSARTNTVESGCMKTAQPKKKMAICCAHVAVCFSS